MKPHHKTTATVAGLVLALSAFATVVQPGLAPQQPQPQPEAIAPEPYLHAAGGTPPAISIGEPVDAARVHVVAEPGLYGLSEPPPENRYAIVDGHLVRVDEDSGKILSILREVEVVDE